MQAIWKEVLRQARTEHVDPALLKNIQSNALEKSEDTPITFGTSGWRGVIGDDFTLYNVQKLTSAIVEFYRLYSGELAPLLGVSSFSEFSRRGVLIGHDTRFLGHTFAKGVASELKKNGVRVCYAGVATTPELSAAVPAGNFACSINLTPSHNPGNYNGYKFNPADGGPAGSEITAKIEECVKKIISFKPHQLLDNAWQPYDAFEAYKSFVAASGFADLDFCREFAHSGSIALAHDAVYGSSMGHISALLNSPGNLKEFKHKEEPLFKGMAPEPSESNMAEVVEYLNKQQQQFKLGSIMDPDGDRVRFYDGESQISMNQFGAIAFHYLVKYRNMQGGVAKSVATSNLANAIGHALGRNIYETAVGFKNFRPNLLPGTSTPAVVAFEESDGISGYGNTLEKDAHIGFLLALEITGRTKKSLTQYLKGLYEEYGVFSPMRYGFEVDMQQMGAPMQKAMSKLKKMFKAGDSIEFGGKSKILVNVIDIDGVKWVFEDKSWLLIRPSGTEPKVRVYAEADSSIITEALFNKGKELFLSLMG